jgi:hypothetical protein
MSESLSAFLANSYAVSDRDYLHPHLPERASLGDGV